MKKKIHNSYVSFDILTFAMYSNNNGNMVVGEIPEFFQFPKRDISTARCKCTIYIFTYKGINVVIRIEFINMIVLLSMWAVFLFFFFSIFFFFTWSWIQFFFKGNSSCNEKLLNYIVRNWIDFRRAEFRCCGSLYSMLLFKKLYLIQIFNQYLLNKKDDTYRPMDTNLSAWI